MLGPVRNPRREEMSLGVPLSASRDTAVSLPRLRLSLVTAAPRAFWVARAWRVNDADDAVRES